MIREDIALVCTCEIAGRVRGKGFPVADVAARLKSGVGWVPTNGMISALGPIADGAPADFDARLADDLEANVFAAIQDQLRRHLPGSVQ